VTPRHSNLARGIFALVLLIALLPTVTHASQTQPRTIRVALLRYYKGIKQVTLSAKSGLNIGDTGKTAPSAMISAGDTGLRLSISGGDPVDAGAPLSVSPVDPTDTVHVAAPGKRECDYRGKIDVILKPAALLLVNAVDLEDYLPGNVPQEMPFTYPLEALKAQAIAARTYALANLGKHDSDGCDLCDTEQCQVYGGVLAERDRCTEAIRATKGIVLLYNGKLAEALYSGDCGGITQDYGEAHATAPIPYLRTVVEPEGLRHASWEATLSLREIENKLVAAGVKEAAGLSSLKVSKTSASGRVLELEVTGVPGTVAISGLKFRNALGARVVRSMLLTMEITPDGNVVMKGKGHGHGQGLCQVGSGGLASPPFNYTCAQILAHYFPGTTLSSQPTSVEITKAKPEAPLETVKPKPDTPAQKSRRVEVAPAPPKTKPAPEEKTDELKFKVRVKAPDRL